jgi:hypothetical protein
MTATRDGLSGGRAGRMSGPFDEQRTCLVRSGKLHDQRQAVKVPTQSWW